MYLFLFRNSSCGGCHGLKNGRNESKPRWYFSMKSLLQSGFRSSLIGARGQQTGTRTGDDTDRGQVPCPTHLANPTLQQNKRQGNLFWATRPFFIARLGGTMNLSPCPMKDSIRNRILNLFKRFKQPQIVICFTQDMITQQRYND